MKNAAKKSPSAIRVFLGVFACLSLLFAILIIIINGVRSTSMQGENAGRIFQYSFCVVDAHSLENLPIKENALLMSVQKDEYEAGDNILIHNTFGFAGKEASSAKAMVLQVQQKADDVYTCINLLDKKTVTLSQANIAGEIKLQIPGIGSFISLCYGINGYLLFVAPFVVLTILFLILSLCVKSRKEEYNEMLAQALSLDTQVEEMPHNPKEQKKGAQLQLAFSDEALSQAEPVVSHEMGATEVLYQEVDKPTEVKRKKVHHRYTPPDIVPFDNNELYEHVFGEDPIDYEQVQKRFNVLRQSIFSNLGTKDRSVKLYIEGLSFKAALMDTTQPNMQETMLEEKPIAPVLEEQEHHEEKVQEQPLEADNPKTVEAILFQTIKEENEPDSPADRAVPDALLEEEQEIPAELALPSEEGIASSDNTAEEEVQPNAAIPSAGIAPEISADPAEKARTEEAEATLLEPEQPVISPPVKFIFGNDVETLPLHKRKVIEEINKIDLDDIFIKIEENKKAIYQKQPPVPISKKQEVSMPEAAGVHAEKTEPQMTFHKKRELDLSDANENEFETVNFFGKKGDTLPRNEAEEDEVSPEEAAELAAFTKQLNRDE